MSDHEVEVKIIISQGVQNQQNGLQQQQMILNPMTIIRSPYIPSALSLAVTFVVAWLDTKQQHDIEVTITNEKNDKRIFTSGKGKTNIVNDSDNMIINADLKNLGFEEEGKYLASINIDGTVYSEDFYVFKQ